MKKDNLFIISFRHHNLFLCIRGDANSYIQVMCTEQWTLNSKRASATTLNSVRSCCFWHSCFLFSVPHSLRVVGESRFVFILSFYIPRNVSSFIFPVSAPARSIEVARWWTNRSGQWWVVDGRGTTSNDEIVFLEQLEGSVATSAWARGCGNSQTVCHKR